MIKLLIFVGAIFILWKLLAGDKKKKEAARHRDQETKAASGQMVRDPMCGTFVPQDSDIRVREDDKVYCFCSYECRDKYIKQIGSSAGIEKKSSQE
jgi:YHS domain-containing protein